MFLEECKYVVKEKRCLTITDDIEISSDSDREDADREDSDEEISNEENSDEQNYDEQN